MVEEIGMLAGKVWECLNDNGKATVKQLSSKVNAPESEVLMAIGWLAREDKLAFSKKGRFLYVSLKTEESSVIANV